MEDLVRLEQLRQCIETVIANDIVYKSIIGKTKTRQYNLHTSLNVKCVISFGKSTIQLNGLFLGPKKTLMQNYKIAKTIQEKEK